MESWGQNTGWRGRREEREGRRPAIFIQLHKRNSHLRKGFPSPPCHVNPRLAAIFNACPRYARSLKGVFLSQERCRPYLSLSPSFSLAGVRSEYSRISRSLPADESRTDSIANSFSSAYFSLRIPLGKVWGSRSSRQSETQVSRYSRWS